MKVTQKKKTAELIRLDVVATAAEVNGALHNAQIAFAQSMGLRPEEGKTVAQVAEEKMGVKDLDSIVEAEAMKLLVPFALDKKNIIPMFPPTPQPKSPFKRNTQFAFELEVSLKPSYELTSYEPVNITIPRYVVDKSLVEAQLAEIAQNYKTYAAAEDKVIESGDICLIAMECLENGKRVNNLCTEGRTYVTGQGYMPDGFDENIIGMKPGETKSFSFEGPSFDDDYNSITQKIDCTLTVKEIQQAVIPEIDDEWIKANMPWYPNAAAFKQDISRSIDAQARRAYDVQVRQVAVEELSKRFEGKIADEVYEATRDNLVNNMRRSLQAQGKSWDEFIEDNGGEQQMGMLLMLQTREVLVQGFVLDAIYRHEKLSITDDDINEACLSINTQANPKQLRAEFEKNGSMFALREAAQRICANKWLVDHANITYTEDDQQ